MTQALHYDLNNPTYSLHLPYHLKLFVEDVTSEFLNYPISHPPLPHPKITLLVTPTFRVILSDM